MSKADNGIAVRCVLYARVSTTDQTCEMQVRELREYATRRGWQVSAEYVDTGWSGAKASRPELDRLMHDAALRRFDAALVWKLDRFGRSVRNCLDGIESLRAHGVRFLAVSQSFGHRRKQSYGNAVAPHPGIRRGV
jgi:putative DNA-invertase from lambdoid prophage Rac